MRILHIKIDLKIKLDIENIAKKTTSHPTTRLQGRSQLENTKRKLHSLKAEAF